MKKISRRSFLAVCGAMAATAALTACGGSSASTAGTTASGSTAGSAAGSAASGEVFELKLSTTQTDTSMIYQGLQAAADKVAEDTDGHVKVTIYPSSQLGGEEDMIDQALQGMGIAVLTDAGRLSSYVNDIGIMNMAYIVDNYEDGMKLMATDTFKGWDADLANNGICGLCYNYYDGARSFMGHKPYKTPADLKGAVIRTPGADPYVESISAMGATPYNIAWSEVYNGIQTNDPIILKQGFTNPAFNFGNTVFHIFPDQIMKFNPIIPRMDQPFIAFCVQDQKNRLFHSLDFINGADDGQVVVVHPKSTAWKGFNGEILFNIILHLRNHHQALSWWKRALPLPTPGCA